jgi:hypothetical protein
MWKRLLTMYSKPIEATWYDLPGSTKEKAETIQLKSSVERGGNTKGTGSCSKWRSARARPARWHHMAPRYFIRRLAWHVLDHAWEIDYRIV